MMRRPSLDITGLASLIPLHAATDVPLRRQLYQGLRRAIITRQLSGGTRLPSSRALANTLELSRTTVLQAYQQLLLEGYLEGRRGSGTYVARTLPDAFLASAQARHASPEQSSLLPMTPPPSLPGGSAPVSAHRPSPFVTSMIVGLSSAKDGLLPPALRAGQLALPAIYYKHASLAFRIGQPALDAFPHRTWQELLARRYRASWQDLFGYPYEPGYQLLREAIASYVGVARGVRCTPQQVIVTSGTSQGLDLIARVLFQPGAAVWMEEPGYWAARWVFQRAGLRVIPVPVDSAGLDLAAGQALYPDACLAYVTPSHQFPLGATMTLERRLALLRWAREQDGWIIEDDYDSEYRYTGRPLPALQGLDEAGRVLYLGTFSKVLFPALRLGYLIVPPALADSFFRTHMEASAYPPLLEQAVVADFMIEGHFQRHIRRMRTLYGQRQAALRETLAQQLPGLLEVPPDPAGMHLVAWLPHGMDGKRVADAARNLGLAMRPLSFFSLSPLRRDALVLGYAAVNEGQIAAGARLLVRAIEGSGIRHVPRGSSTGWTRYAGPASQPNDPSPAPDAPNKRARQPTRPLGSA